MILVLIGVLLLFIIGSLLLVMLIFNQSKSLVTEKEEELPAVKPAPFPWKAVIFPLAIFLLSIVMVVFFFNKIPVEAGSRFDPDGTPTAWTTRGTLIMWAILPQFMLALLAFVVSWGVSRIGSITRSKEGSGINLDNLLLVMGNMIALPQLILGFAMLNTFGYNAYQTRLVPLWAVILVTVVVGTVILGIFFITTIRKAWIKENK